MDKNNNVIIVILAIIILATFVYVLNYLYFTKSGYQENLTIKQSLNQTDTELDQAITSDTTDDITKNLDTINVDDPVEDADLNIIDQELEKL